MRNSTLLYSEIMLSGESGLSRIQREMIATAVSRANGCHY
jgi:alkylhydroperoxidase family enzyme